MTTALSDAARRHVAIAQRVADAHRGIDDESLLAFVSGSTVDDLVDELSDVDMSVVFAVMPPGAVLHEACRRVGGPWAWTMGDFAQGGAVVSFPVDGVEVQIGYATHANLAADVDDLLIAHNPDTPNHKLAEGIAKALPLAGATQLSALQARLDDFPHGLRCAMVRHALSAPTPWRAARQLVRRDAALWCREIQVEACYRLLLALCGLNRRWFTRFQVKRMHRLASRFEFAPPRLADRIEVLLAAPAREAFEALHALEGDVLELVARHLPDVDLEAALKRHAAWP